MGNALESICMSGYNEGGNTIYIIIKKYFNFFFYVCFFFISLVLFIIMFKGTTRIKKGIEIFITTTILPVLLLRFFLCKIIVCN